MPEPASPPYKGARRARARRRFRFTETFDELERHLEALAEGGRGLTLAIPVALLVSTEIGASA